LSITHILVYGLSLFAICYLLHLIIWRIRRPTAYPIWLPAIFFVLPLLTAIFILAANLSVDLPSPRFIRLLAIFLLHASLSSAYIVFYSGLIAFSPSLAILEAIDQSMPSGLHYEELFLPWFNHKNLAGLRIENLIAAQMLVETQNLLCLTAKGRLVAWCFRLYRRSIGLPEVSEG